MSDVAAEPLLTTPLVTIRDVTCAGASCDPGTEEAATAAHLVFPYRGVYVRHVGGDQAVAEANQVLFFNPDEGYRVTHPVPGGDSSLDLVVSESLLSELAAPALLRKGPRVAFRSQRRRVDPRTQVLGALLRHGLHQRNAETLEAESLALALARRAMGTRTTHTPGAGAGRRRLVDRAKILLSSNLARRWTLTDVATDVGQSPVYLTQIFQQVEGLPLYRYQLRLRLARALDLLRQCEDLTALSLELGFSSHAHFSTAFRHAYGRSPSEFRRSARERATASRHR